MDMCIREAKLLKSNNTFYKVVVVERSDIDSGSYVYDSSDSNKLKLK